MKKRIIIILLILILTASIILIILLKKKEKIEAPMVSGTEFYGESKDTLEDYYPKGLFNLTKKYNGRQSNIEIKDCTSDFIKLVQEINENGNESYFKENRNYLRRFGITNQEEYDLIASKIKSLNKEELVYENSRLDAKSIEKIDGYIKVKLYVKFANCQEIEFTEKIKEDSKENLDYIFS